jgi:hypothetical protein
LVTMFRSRWRTALAAAAATVLLMGAGAMMTHHLASRAAVLSLAGDQPDGCATSGCGSGRWGSTSWPPLPCSEWE